MPDKRERTTVNIRKELANKIKKLALKENRSFTGQAHALIEEALVQRNGETTPALETSNALLYKLSDLELQQHIELAAQIARQRMEAGSQERIPDNVFARKVKQYKKDCLPMWKSQKQRLDDIISGAQPSEEELLLFEACLPLAADEIWSLYRRGFGLDGENSDCPKCNGGCS